MRRSLGRIAFALLGLAVLASGVGMCSRVAERGRYASPYSSLGSGPDGTRALFLVAESLGASPRRWTRDLSNLPAGGMLLAFGGCDLSVHRPVRRYEAEALSRWVEGGGVLVVAGATDYLPADLGVALRRPSGQCGDLLPDFLRVDRASDEAEAGEDDVREPEVVDFPAGDDAPAAAEAEAEAEDDDEEGELPTRWAKPVSPILAGLAEVPMVAPARVVVDEGTEHDVLLAIAGEPAGVVVPRGRGAVVALSSATPFENEWLYDALGGVLLFRLRDAHRASSAVLFDEYHLGVGAGRSIIEYLRGLGAAPMLAQLAFAVGLLLHRLGARLGRPIAPATPEAAGSEHYVEAIGGLYARSGDLSGVADLLRRRALSRVARHHRVDSHDAAVIAGRVSGRVGVASREAILALGEAGVEVATPKELAERVRRIDALEQAALGESDEKRSDHR